MAASPEQLLAFYQALFSRDPAVRAERIAKVGAILGTLERWSPDATIGARLAAAVGLPPDALELNMEQLGCMQAAFTGRPFGAISPENPEMQSLFLKLFWEGGSFPSIRWLQAAGADCFKCEVEPQLGQAKRAALLGGLQRIAPGVEWSPAHVDALVALLGRDVSYRTLAPVDIADDAW